MRTWTWTSTSKSKSPGFSSTSTFESQLSSFGKLRLFLLRKSMPRIFFCCSYDGVPFRGWQSQQGGGTLQDTLETVFASILKEPIRIAASGRTDAGVHARGQCFHADVPEGCRMLPAAWVAALNAKLPPSIRIWDAKVVGSSFHARFSATGKVYEYLICRSAVLSPFLAGRVWHLPHEFDVSLLEKALHCYVGTHDFRRFAARRGNEPENPPADFYIRHIYAATVREQAENVLCLRFHGNGFMYRMVRLLVGTAHQVARGRMSVPQLTAMLEQPLGEKSRYCAPAHGLYLHQVLY